MEWDDDDRATCKSMGYSSNNQEPPQYVPVFKIMKQLYDEEKESRYVKKPFKRQQTVIDLPALVEPLPLVVVAVEPVVELSAETLVEEEEDEESDIVNSVLENKINNKFCYY